jgi:hypothetical protein
MEKSPLDPATGTSERNRAAAVALGLVVLTAAVYAPVVRTVFLLIDDPGTIVENPGIRAGVSVQGLVWAFRSTWGANWFPVTWLSHLLDYQLFGLDPRGHYAVNLLLHCANVALLFGLLRAATGRLWPSVLAAALYSVHPLRLESVAWISSRKDVLSGFFWLLALAAYLRYARRPGRLRLLAVTALLALGLMSKPTTVTLPLVALVLDWWPLGRLRAQGVKPAAIHPRPGQRAVAGLLVEKLPLLALSAAAAAVTVYAQGSHGAMGMVDVPLASRIGNALSACGVYLRKTVLPNDLAIFYPHPEGALPTPSVLAGLGVVLAVSLVAAAQARRRPWLGAGWSWYLITLVPTLGFVQVGGQAQADRYTYLPHIGVAIAAAWSVAGTTPRPGFARSRAAVGVVALGALVACCRYQAGFWENSFTLLTRATAVTERNYAAENNLGVLWATRGDFARAREHFRLALAYRPSHLEAQLNLRRVENDLLRAGAARGAPGHGGPSPRQFY